MFELEVVPPPNIAHVVDGLVIGIEPWVCNYSRWLQSLRQSGSQGNPAVKNCVSHSILLQFALSVPILSLRL